MTTRARETLIAPAEVEAPTTPPIELPPGPAWRRAASIDAGTLAAPLDNIELIEEGCMAVTIAGRSSPKYLEGNPGNIEDLAIAASDGAPIDLRRK